VLLDPMKVLHVERLLAQGDLSQRQIACLAGVGRASVAAIAETRRCHLPEDGMLGTSSHPARCPGCGGLVLFLPCRLCHVRSLLDRKKRRPAWRTKTLEGG
jgi:hypothetical protein